MWLRVTAPGVGRKEREKGRKGKTDIKFSRRLSGWPYIGKMIRRVGGEEIGNNAILKSTSKLVLFIHLFF